MTKVSGVLPKESPVSVQAEAKLKLWDAVPMLCGENLKAWFPRAARVMAQTAVAAGYPKTVHWTPRRIRALWNGEARRIDHFEMRVIDLRIRLNELEERASKRRGTLNEIAIAIAEAKADARAAYRGSRAVAPHRDGEGHRGGGSEAGGGGGARARQATATSMTPLFDGLARQ